jgi:hypothetical protein
MKTIILFAVSFICSAYAGNSLVHFAIKKIKNDTPYRCTVDKTEVYPEGTLSLKSPLSVPFISLKSYLKKVLSQKPFVPEKALQILTAHGKYLLWASESGIQCARDPKEVELEIDAPWQVETLSSPKEHEGKTLSLATLVFNLFQGKTKISLR